jgi:cobalt-zinc-cadmium efflux system membrane fusion protein
VGETVRAAVLLEHPNGKTVLAVPQNALQTVEDKPSVFVRTNDGFAVRPVTLGPSNGNYVTVVSGLTGDERVAVTNSYVLKAELGKGEGGDDD